MLDASIDARRGTFPGSRDLVRFALLSAMTTMTLIAPLGAQTGYYNTDRGRPVRIEDAYAIERFSLDVHLGPMTLERRGGRDAWTVDPELSFGLLPRTQIDLGLPLAIRETEDGRRVGLGGVDVAALYSLNAETHAWPALGVRAGALLPAGRFGPDEVRPSIQGMATRTFRWARVHANLAYTWGTPTRPPAGDAVAGGAAEASRWLSGAAVDKVFPRPGLLLTGEVFAAGPITPDSPVQWNVGAGSKYQLRPDCTVDVAIHRRVAGESLGWAVTVGVSRVTGVRELPWGFGRWGRP